MQKIQSFVEQGNTTLAISGAAGTIARKVQGSFPSATVTVYNAGTLVLASIFSDDGSPPTVKANPFTSASDGTWFFYAAPGLYDVKFSGGGIATPFTIGALGASIATYLGLGYLSAADYPGADAGAKIAAAVAALPAGGGIVDARSLVGAQSISTAITISIAGVTILLGPSTYTTSGTGQIIIANGAHDFRLIGTGSGLNIGGAIATDGTIITHANANAFIGVAATAVAHRCVLQGFLINTTSTSTSAYAIQVGTTGTTFSENNFREHWIIRDVAISGPGETNAGLIGVSLTQLARAHIEHFHIESYETNWIMCSTDECYLADLQVDFFKNGMQWLRTPSHPIGGAASDRVFGLRFHGPTVTGGESLYLDVQDVQFVGIYNELNTIGLTAKCFAEFTGNGQYCRFIDAFWEFTNGTVTNMMNFAPGSTGAGRNVFVGMFTNNGSAPAIAMTDPSGGGGSTQNVFIGCDSFFTSTLATPVSNGYAIVIGQDSGGSAIDLQGNVWAKQKIGIQNSPSFALHVNTANSSGTFGNVIQGMLSNTDTTDSNWIALGFSKGGSALDAAVAAQIRNHATGVTDLILAGGTGSGVQEKWRVIGDQGGLQCQPVHFANLGTPSNGTIVYCDDCTIANPCAGSGNGAFAKRLNGVWVCN